MFPAPETFTEQIQQERYRNANQRALDIKDTHEIEKDSLQCRRPARVSFDTVTVREFEWELGDNPSCSSGPPLTLAWTPFRQWAISLDKYENMREFTFCRRNGKDDLLIPRDKRERILREMGRSKLSVYVATFQTRQLRIDNLKSVHEYRINKWRRNRMKAVHSDMTRRLSQLKT